MELATLTQIASIIVPFLVLAITGLGVWLRKIDDRIFHMQTQFVTKEELNDKLDRIERDLTEIKSFLMNANKDR